MTSTTVDICPRHDGPWGSDSACLLCTDDTGRARVRCDVEDGSDAEGARVAGAWDSRELFRSVDDPEAGA